MSASRLPRVPMRQGESTVPRTVVSFSCTIAPVMRSAPVRHPGGRR
ncbi:hypothetical protein NSERUTF1_0593 [Nocardia seriolae]|nr:hypothetical protein NSERUTF1_0593 [Nocardia seriolae]